MRCLELILLLALLLPKHAPASKSDIVKAWARTLGDELWRLNEALTKSDQIRMKYKQMNASVKKKNGKLILDSSLRSVSTMLTRKINAVKCIHATAEKLAKEFNYYNMTKDKTFVNSIEYCDAKYSDFENILASDNNLAPRPELPGFAEDNPNFKPITLEKDSHFYNISVNTNTSCVHVPTNIFYREADAFNAILWTKELNDIFRKNYQSDPSLSWQYFGSSHGILRFYPAMPWNRVKHADTYDCRVKSWYIEAATCSKDVIILFDVSGSMTGFKNYVARITLKSLLETLSNNDYVNVYTFKNTTSVVVTCFSGLVQATQENINTILTTLQPINGTQHRVPLEGNANLTKAYIEAFTTLKEKRVKCNVSSTQGCNQLVMLITDYVPGNLSEVFDEYNREVVGNKTYTPVRVFTYLIGKEVTNVQEIQSMACNNRGYFAHIHSVEEVQQQVLKYINVIARPMILQGEEPPPTWTHANLDETRTKAWNVSGDIDLQDEDKLVTSVAIPAFDYRHNEDNNDAILLGVAGTDVPIDNIAKLAQPHQLGVNGYSFIVSNNGYLLLHPLLIATINRKLQMNYNSIDFVEVEQVDDGKGPRELGDKIKELREHLVNGDDGQMTNVEVLFHYDSMRRISRVKHDYFFNSLSGTPFSMGISLPRVYGDTELLLKDNPLEAKQGKELTGINVTDYFRFSYRVHPDWVYCKYHYLEGHETAYPELEIWGFLVNLSNNEIDITKRQYIEETETEFSVETHCGNATKELGRDSYYCNEDLVKQLVFDAKLSTPYFQDWDASLSDRRLAEVYNVSVRFIATSSGLTRWHYIFDEYKNEWVDETGHRINNFTGEVFGDKNHNSIEETWYKAAVLQAMINKESIVVATPLPVLDETIEDKGYVVKDGDITITASYAIFYKDGESETPASVVGFQYSHSQFHDRFVDIIDNKDLECGENYECFLIDSSGYIVVSVPTNKDLLKTDQVGQFFGAVNRDNALVLQYLVDRTIYDTVEVFNYQALCPLSVLKEPNCAWLLRSPFDITKNFIRWLMTELVLMIMNWNQYAFGLEDPDYVDIINEENADAATTAVPPSMEKNDTISPEDDEETTFSCDHRISLYILNQRYFTESTGVPRAVFEDDVGACHPPFWAAYVMKTNLLLVVVEKGDWVFNESCPLPPETKPLPTENSTTSREPCHKLDLGALYRRRLEGCYTYHEKEEDIKQCGHGSILTANPVIFFIAVFLASIVNLRPAPGSVT